VKVSYPKAEIFVSSGIRRGTDVMKCLALGATAVFVKRPIMMALFFQGQDAVNHMINLLNEELKLAMALTSCFKVNEITTT
jgi:isopentenyl diphosphate isomerase/L-lactate dehydrogenase-like FMN-dependent dehydrogenase